MYIHEIQRFYKDKKNFGAYAVNVKQHCNCSYSVHNSLADKCPFSHTFLYPSPQILRF